MLFLFLERDGPAWANLGCFPRLTNFRGRGRMTDHYRRIEAVGRFEEVGVIVVALSGLDAFLEVDPQGPCGFGHLAVTRGRIGSRARSAIGSRRNRSTER